MDILIQLLLTLVGLALLWGGAEVVVKNSISLASKLGISPLIVGLTVVSLGTSFPELVVSSTAAIQNDIGISIGNIVGSNISNVGLILGIAALLMPIVVRRQWITREIPAMLAITVIFYLFARSGQVISTFEGVILLIILALYMLYLTRFTLHEMEEFKELNQSNPEEEDQKFPWRKRHFSLLATLGLVGLIAGSKLAVDSGTNLAEMLGVSDAIIGLTLIAFGTSLPELATTAVSAMRKEADLALGNIIGSNIFNLALIGGITALIRPIPIGHEAKLGAVEFPILLGISFLLYIFAIFGRRIGKIKGIILLVGYLGFLILTVGGL